LKTITNTLLDTDDDGAGGIRERVLSTLLNEMDGVGIKSKVLVLACTNRPDRVDDALLRPGKYINHFTCWFFCSYTLLGRLDHLVYVGPPDLKERREILETQYQRIKDCQINVDQLAQQTDGFTSAGLLQLVRQVCYDR
jgi:SpoVK/Ycf46/Vps4 family AAA+-type ATPase